MAKMVLNTGPAEEPVTLLEAQRFLAIHGSYDDQILADMLVGAREAAEQQTYSRFVTQTWGQYFDQFADPLVLRYPPVASSSSLTYVDTAGDTQTVSTDTYELGEDNGIGILRLKYNQTWPTDVRSQPDSVIATQVVGYGLATAVPQRIKQAIMILAGQQYRDREGVDSGPPTAYFSSLEPFSYRKKAAVA